MDQSSASLHPATGRVVVRHALPVRLTHWLTALAILVMVGSGWRIYGWEPIIPGLRFPFWMTLGGAYVRSQEVHNETGLAGALQWHFAGMWLLAASFGIYALHSLRSGHFRRSLLPVLPPMITGRARTARLDEEVDA